MTRLTLLMLIAACVTTPLAAAGLSQVPVDMEQIACVPLPNGLIQCDPWPYFQPPPQAAPRHEHTLPEMAGYWALGGLHVADLAYTQALLLRGWGHEGNPAISWATSHPATFTAVKWGAAGAGMFATWRLFESGHPRVGWAAIATQAAITGWAVAHNARIYRTCRQPGVSCH